MSDSADNLRIKELRARIEVLAQENMQLAERSEDTMLLGIVSEQVNVASTLGQVLEYALERISILKDISFCAYGVRLDKQLVLKEYYFSLSEEQILTKNISLPCDKLQGGNVFCCSGKQLTDLDLSLSFGQHSFTPSALLLIRAKSELNPGCFIFASAESDAKSYLTNISELLERICEMIVGRLENLILLDSLRGLNRELDQKVLDRTAELTAANQELSLEIDNRKRAEQELLEERERLAVTLRSIGDGVITTDVNGDVVLVNEVAEKFTGQTQAEAQGKPLAEVFNIINENTRKPSANPVEKVLKSGEIIALANHTALIARDGTERSIADSGAPIRDNSGKIIGVVLVFRDVTLAKKMEEAALKTKKLESVGVLAGGIAHDFNNILAAIMGNISLSLIYVKPEDKVYDLLSEAEKASMRAKNLTQQLLTFSKGGEPVKQLAALPDVVRDSADFVLRGSNIRCEYNFAKDLLPVEIDAGQISQVIQNLIINSTHAMPMGGIIKVSAENFDNRSSQLVTLHPGSYVKLDIVDQGVGIKADLLERIFDPYFTTKQEGSGLGLAITHAIISKHAGSILVESELGVGSRFSIYLPATAMVIEKSVITGSVLEKNPDKGGRIMIMDDEEMLRNMVTQMLSRFGCEVISVADGAEALQIYRASQKTDAPIDLVIMDLTIPGGMGGQEAIKELLLIDPKVRAIVASGYSNDPVMANYADYGFCAAIVKPFQLNDLMQAVDQALSLVS
jgi:PAS domain S-box-containing protein